MSVKWIERSLILAILATVSLAAQSVPNIRAPDINGETPEGQLLTEAGLAESPDEKIAPLETFVERHSDNPHIGYVYLQLQTLYLAQENYDKSVTYGKKLLEIVPNDVEVRHNVNKALVAKQDWDALLPELVATKPVAEKTAAAPKPGDSDEAAVWQGQVDYAKGVMDYTEWALNVGATQMTDPQKMIQWMDTLKQNFPESQYLPSLAGNYAIAYQQLGDTEKMVAAMKTAIESDPMNETYLYALAEDALSKQNFEETYKYADQLIQAMAQKPKPEGVSDEDWAKNTSKFTVLGKFVKGRGLVVENKFREGRAVLLETVDAMKEEGGQRYGALAYFLGVCYVKLDIQGDNIQKATYWMGEAARTESPFTAEAKKAVAAIKGQ